MNGLVSYFDQSLPHFLLYHQEMAQHREVCLWGSWLGVRVRSRSIVSVALTEQVFYLPEPCSQRYCSKHKISALSQ